MMRSTLKLKRIFYFAWLFLLPFESMSVGALFLRISPGARSTGMGEAFTSIVDPVAAHFNPGTMGIFALDHHLAAGYSYCDWLPAFKIDDLYMEYKHAFVGFSLRDLNKNLPFDLSMGIEYHQQYLNLGEFERRGENNEYLGTYNPWEKNDNIGISFGVSYIIEAGVGWSFSSITLDYGDRGAGGIDLPEQKTETRDFGYLIRLPIVNAVHKLSGFDFDNIIDPFRLEIIPAYGYSYLNEGSGKLYLPGWYSDDYPEVEKRRYSFDATIRYNNLPFLEFIYSRDLIKDQYTFRGEESAMDGLGQELTVFGFLQYRWGRHRDTFNNSSFSTEGYSFRSRGLTQYLHKYLLKNKMKDGGITEYLLTHIDLSYSWSNRDAGEDHPIQDTKWWEVGLSL